MSLGISVRQPYVWAFFNAGKGIENRGLYTEHRGELYIHASKSTGNFEDFDSAVDGIIQLCKRDLTQGSLAGYCIPGLAELVHFDKGRFRGESLWRPAAELARGGIVGRCNLVDVIWPDGRRGSGTARHELADDPWYTGGFGLVLRDFELLSFRPCLGQLGTPLFHVPSAA